MLVNRQNQEEVWQALYGSPSAKIRPPKLKSGDTMRLAQARSFSKGYLPQWTEERFRVKTVRKTAHVTYTVTDIHGKDVRGSFYEEELQKVPEPDHNKIEKKICEGERRIKASSAVVRLRCGI